jgi:hypothetical protein
VVPVRGTGSFEADGQQSKRRRRAGLTPWTATNPLPLAKNCGEVAGLLLGKVQEAFVFDLATEQGLCILGSEYVVVEGMYADSGQFVLGDWRD